MITLVAESSVAKSFAADLLGDESLVVESFAGEILVDKTFATKVDGAVFSTGFRTVAFVETATFRDAFALTIDATFVLRHSSDDDFRVFGGDATAWSKSDA